MKFCDNKVESIRCFIEDCKEKPINTCKCLGFKEFICRNHTAGHENINENHEIKGIFLPINEKSREIFRRNAEELKNKVNLYWNEVINNEVYRFHHNMYLMNLNVRIINEKCEEIISSCENLTEILEYKDPTYISIILKSPPESIELFFCNWKISTLKDYEEIVYSLGKLFSIEPIYNFEHNLNNELSMNSTQMLYFKKNDFNLYAFNFENSQITQNPSNQIPEFYASMCILPNKEIFCLWNSSSKTITIKINSVIQMHPSRTYTNFTGLIYYKGFVYAFGGSGNFWEKFDIDKSVWIKIARLPRTTDYCSCAVLAETILVVGYHSLKLHGYCPELNSYFDCMNVTGDTQKNIFTGNNRGYLMEFGKGIYESEINNPFSWQNIGTNSCKNTFILSGKILYEESVCFLNYYYELFRFDLKNKTISVIANLKDK